MQCDVNIAACPPAMTWTEGTKVYRLIIYHSILHFVTLPHDASQPSHLDPKHISFDVVCQSFWSFLQFHDSTRESLRAGLSNLSLHFTTVPESIPTSAYDPTTSTVKGSGHNSVVLVKAFMGSFHVYNAVKGGSLMEGITLSG